MILNYLQKAIKSSITDQLTNKVLTILNTSNFKVNYETNHIY